MNFIGNKLIPAALFAATASVAISAAPAQALSISGSSFSFSGAGLEVDEVAFGDDAATFNFFGPVGVSSGTGIFSGFDLVEFNSPLDVVGGDGSLADFIIDINTSAGVLTYSITGLTEYTEKIVNGIQTYDLGLMGVFSDGSGTAIGNGAMELTYDKQSGAFAGTVNAVPTPAAVLPIIAGLFGAASRKKQEEEA